MGRKHGYEESVPRSIKLIFKVDVRLNRFFKVVNNPWINLRFYLIDGWSRILDLQVRRQGNIRIEGGHYLGKRTENLLSFLSVVAFTELSFKLSLDPSHYRKDGLVSRKITIWFRAMHRWGLSFI